MSEPKRDRHRAAITMRVSILLLVMAVLGAAAWQVGASYLAGNGASPVAASTECDSCTLHHRDMQRMRKILKEQGQSNK